MNTETASQETMHADHPDLNERWEMLHRSFNEYKGVASFDSQKSGLEWDFARHVARFVMFVNKNDPNELTDRDHQVIFAGAEMIVDWFTTSPDAVSGYLLQKRQTETRFNTYLTDEHISRILVASACD